MRFGTLIITDSLLEQLGKKFSEQHIGEKTGETFLSYVEQWAKRPAWKRMKIAA